MAELENFDFDVKFKVVSFNISANLNGFVQSFTVESNIISQEQKNLISRINKGDKIYIEDIKAIGPTGKIREVK